jgi:hypothetical protein
MAMIVLPQILKIIINLLKLMLKYAGSQSKAAKKGGGLRQSRQGFVAELHELSKKFTLEAELNQCKFNEAV